MLFDQKRVPIGYEDFKEIIDGGFYYVDKTMLIYDILRKGGQSTLLTRPRRFGKTLNFSMLKYFFDINEKDNAHIFDGLKISEYYDELKNYRNTRPVISLSMKGGKRNDYAWALKSICEEIHRQYIKYRFILEGNKLSEEHKRSFNAILSYEKPDETLFSGSIKLLSECLYEYYGVKAVILIDEYDVPLENSYFRGFYDEMVGFIRSLFESALKTNGALEFSVITGCLRISKESIFTGLNNLAANTILSYDFSEHFGFTQEEIADMLKYYGIESKLDEMKTWYDGYLFGDTEVYNPWSVINQTAIWSRHPNLPAEVWWTNTSSNEIIKSLVEKADDSTKAVLEELINGGSVKCYLNQTITYGDMYNANENIWNFLFFTGYLKTVGYERINSKSLYTLVIPNTEIRCCYIDVIMEYFDIFKRQVNKDELYKALLSRDADGFANQITSLLKKSISYYDNAENFYHGLILGLLSGNNYYRLKSNRETGDGRCDIALYQEDDNVTAVIIELKVCKGNETPKAKAAEAVKQITEMDYASDARSLGYTNIIKYGIAFKKKLCYAAVE